MSNRLSKAVMELRTWKVCGCFDGDRPLPTERRSRVMGLFLHFRNVVGK